MSRTITVDGTSCGHCGRTVEDALEGVAGVTTVSADHEAASATVEGEADADALVAAVENAGYEASA